MSGNTFEIVAVDEQDRTIDVQHFDGTIEELDFDAWDELEVEAIEAPEDWSGSVDVDFEDMPESELQANHGWHNPLEFIDNYE